MPRFGPAFAFGNDAMFRTNGEAVFGDHNRGSMLAKSYLFSAGPCSPNEQRSRSTGKHVAEYKGGDVWK
jgi:hypothetical protein